MASTVRSDPVGSVGGFVIMVVAFVFRGFIPAPSWVWWAVLAVGILLAVKGGISGLDVVTLGIAVFVIAGSLVAGAFTATSEVPDLRKLDEPIPVPAGYGFRPDGLQRDFDHEYRSKPFPVKMANQAAADVVDYYVAGLAPEWTLVDRQEDLGYGDGLNAQAKFRQGDASNGIGIQAYAHVWGRSATVVLSIRTLNCGEDVPGSC